MKGLNLDENYQRSGCGPLIGGRCIMLDNGVGSRCSV